MQKKLPSEREARSNMTPKAFCLPEFTWDSEKKCLVPLSDTAKIIQDVIDSAPQKPKYNIRTQKAIELARKNGLGVISFEVDSGMFERFDILYTGFLLNTGLKTLSSFGTFLVSSKDFFWNSITENWEVYTKEDYREYQTRLITGWTYPMLKNLAPYLCEKNKTFYLWDNYRGGYDKVLKWDEESERYRKIKLVEEWDD